MIDAINFFIYRMAVSFYFTRFLEECSFLEGFGYSEGFYDFYKDGDWHPADAVLEELSNWTD